MRRVSPTWLAVMTSLLARYRHAKLLRHPCFPGRDIRSLSWARNRQITLLAPSRQGRGDLQNIDREEEGKKLTTTSHTHAPHDLRQHMQV
ncbi:hypothetical protein V8C43DRAFT_292189 [Trichoderma afarasin]